MKKVDKKIVVMLVAAVAALTVACGSAQVDPNAASRSLGGNMVVDAANGQLAKVPVVGFPPFGTTMSTAQFDKYGSEAATAAKAVIGTLPEGYVLQITGHANAHKSLSTAGVTKLSQGRANYVYNYFVKKGIDKTKLTAVGVGASEPDASLSHDQLRRVTFKVVEKK
jgi:hypothetical protein